VDQEFTNVLLVEDDEDDYVLSRNMLSNKPFYIVWTQTLTAALKHLRTMQDVDVILLDLSLLDSQGVDALDAISACAKQIPIVVLTGMEDEQTAAEALQRGAQDYLIKGKITPELIERSLRYSMARKQSENDARRISLFQQREDFMAMLAHDLKNPIIGANRILELLAAGELGALADEQRTVIEQLKTNNGRLLTMIRAYLDACKYEAGAATISLRNSDLSKLLNSALLEFTSLARDKKVDLKVEIENDVPQVLADDSTFYRVIQNLLHNAIKFTPEGGSISVRLYHTADAEVLEIHNDGSVIPIEDQGRLFERFWQGVGGKKYAPGTGLGLYLCKHIVDAHHGHIACTSSHNTGTTFTVKLPLPKTSVSPQKAGSTSGAT